ncbi:MAG: hypothetical protein JWQ83_1852 [Lacunisphaera sp.]|nr:hypothetical protein [Lacunisphaera sp.]
MASAQTTPRPPAAFPWLMLSWLAPVTWGLGPILLLAFASPETFVPRENEAYEWTQHRVAGLGFTTAFALVLLFGPWRRNWATICGGLLGLGMFAAILLFDGWAGLTPWFVVAALMVAAGYGLARRDAPPQLLELALVTLAAMMGFWAVSRMAWWHPPLLESWPNRILFMGVTAGLVAVLRAMQAGPGVPADRWSARAIDGAVLLVLAGAVLRTNILDGEEAFSTHWGFFVASADMVREGGAFLTNVPSQYGFLNTLLVAVLPTEDRFTALFWLNSVLVWISGAVLYYTLKTWLARWWWQMGAGLITICSLAFLCGIAPKQTGPLPCPSVGAMRFICVYLLLGYLVWWHRRGRADRGSIRVALWIGSSLWLCGVLWSAESAVYVTATWFPAAVILAMQPTVEELSGARRLVSLATGIGRALIIPALLLTLAVAGLAGYYRWALGRPIHWAQYWEYASAFSTGFGALPIDPRGGVWALLLLHVTLLANLVEIEVDRRRASLALLWAAWGAFWTVSTYFVSRSHDNNITNLSPLLLLVLGAMVHAWGTGNRHGAAGLWVWVTVPSFAGAMLWLVLGNPAVLKRQWETYAIQPHTARLLPAVPPELTELVNRCQQIHPGRYTVLGEGYLTSPKAEIATEHADWLALRSVPLLYPLPPARRAFYLDAYSRGRAAGWLVSPVAFEGRQNDWIFDYIAPRYALQLTLENGGWRAGYYMPREEAPPASGP